MINSHFNNLTYRTNNRWRSVDAHFQNGAASVFLSLWAWNTANAVFMILCIQSPSRLLMMQDKKSLMRHWLSCSGWGKERVSLVFSYKGGRFIRKDQWCAKVNILRLTVGYLNATIHRKTWSTEPEIGTNGSSQTWENPRGWLVRVRVWPAKMLRVGFLDGSETEPNSFSGLEPDSWRVTRTRC
jgi:hypothetical protein